MQDAARAALAAKLAKLYGDQMLDIIDGFVNASPEITAALLLMGWTDDDLATFAALIKTAAQHHLIDGNRWCGRIGLPKGIPAEATASASRG